MACGDELTFNIDNTTSLEIDDKGYCIPPSQFDSMVDYNSNIPFKGFSDTIVKNLNIKLPLTFTQYVSFLEKRKEKVKNIYQAGFGQSIRYFIPNGNSYKVQNNNNNPLNIKFSTNELSSFKSRKLKNFLSNKTSTLISTFDNMSIGTVACIGYLKEKCNGMNLCQIYKLLSYNKYNAKDKNITKSRCIQNMYLPLLWVGRAINQLNNNKQWNIKTDWQIDLTHKDTLICLMYILSIIQSKTHFQYGFLETAYNIYINA